MEVSRGSSIETALIALVLVLPGSATAISSKAVNSLKGFIAFDKLYVDALLLTESGSDLSPQQLRRLGHHWKKYVSEFGGYLPRFKKPAEKVHKAILVAKGLVKEKDWARARAALEPIRAILRDYRQDTHFPYYFDYLTAYHSEIEKLLKMASTQLGGGKVPRFAKRAEAGLDRADKIWRKAERAEFNTKMHGFDEAREARRKELIKGVRKSLEQAYDGLYGFDEDERDLALALKKLELPFARLFKLFGGD